MTRSPALSALLLVAVWSAAPSAQHLSGQPARLAPDSSRSTTKAPAKWWKDPTIAGVVGLTTRQAERIDRLFDEFIRPQREKWAAFRRLEVQVEDFLRNPPADDQLVVDRITALEDRRREINRNRLLMLFKIQRVLSPAQRSKLRDVALWLPGGRTMAAHDTALTGVSLRHARRCWDGLRCLG